MFLFEISAEFLDSLGWNLHYNNSAVEQFFLAQPVMPHIYIRTQKTVQIKP